MIIYSYSYLKIKYKKKLVINNILLIKNFKALNNKKNTHTRIIMNLKRNEEFENTLKKRKLKLK